MSSVLEGLDVNQDCVVDRADLAAWGLEKKKKPLSLTAAPAEMIDDGDNVRSRRQPPVRANLPHRPHSIASSFNDGGRSGDGGDLFDVLANEVRRRKKKKEWV